MKRTQTAFRASTMLALGLVCACQRTSPSPPTTSVAAVRNHAETAVSPSSTRAKDGDAFDVKVSLSEAAQERLRGKETVIVSATYFGYPSAQAIAEKAYGAEYPWLTLDNRQIELSGAGTATFPPMRFDLKQLALLDDPDRPQVNINVFSGRKSSENNLLDCGLFQDTLTVAASAPIKIHCKLIGESR
jgi:hypothetical protein